MNGFSRRTFALLLLGFASGLPLALSGDLLAAWLSDLGFDTTKIGLLGLAGLPYAYKVIWSPLVDRYALPVVGRRLGRRRGWMVGSQLLLMGAILVLSWTDPRVSLIAVGGAATAVAFFSATQDIVVDAWRADILEPKERGPGAAISVCGYRLGMIASGAGGLILVGHFHWSWPVACRATAAAMGVGLIGAMIAPEPGGAAVPPSIAAAVVRPLGDLLGRRMGWVVLLFVFIFKLPEHLANAMSLPFLLKIGLLKQDIGEIRQGLGVGITIVGALLGGVMVKRIGVWRSLWIFGVLHSVSNLAFCAMTHIGASYGAMVGVIGVENLCIGLTTAGFTAWMIGQCDPRYSAFQFALLSGVMAGGRVLAAPLAGWMAQRLGWGEFFAVSAMFGLPGLALLPWLKQREIEGSPRGVELSDGPLSAMAVGEIELQ